jgi:pimeloyl-ACP methyl ester carboxylesterase
MKRTLSHALHIVRLTAALLLAAALPAQSATAFKAEVTGSGPAVILIPGLASSGEVWQDTAAHLCQQRQCHILTLAGFAGVPALPDAQLLPAAEQQLADYIASNHLDKPLVIGHSLGGFLGMKLAIDHPDKVGRLVIVDALPALAATQAPNASKAQLQGIAAGLRDAMQKQDATTFGTMQQRSVASMVTSPQQAQRIAAWGKVSDRATITNAMYDILASDLRDDVARIQAPTLVLGTWVAYQAFATKDIVEAGFRAQYAKLPNVQIAMAATARHFVMVDEPEWMYARIDQFLQ